MIGRQRSPASWAVCSSTTSQDLCSLPLNSCPSRGLRTKSQPPPGLPFPGCVRNSESRPRTMLHPNRSVMVTTNAQQTPALRNRNLTCSTRPRGQLTSYGSAPPLPGSPRVPSLGSLGSAAPGSAGAPTGELPTCPAPPPPAAGSQDPGSHAAHRCQVLLDAPADITWLLSGAVSWKQSQRHLLWWGAAGQAKDKASSRLNHLPLCGNPQLYPCP